MEDKPKKKRYSRQQLKKLSDGECLVCGEKKYELLDAHRIVEQGPYISSNIIVLCCACHRLTHSGEIKFDRRKYNSTKGVVIHWWLNGEEQWTPVKS